MWLFSIYFVIFPDCKPGLVLFLFALVQSARLLLSLDLLASSLPTCL